MKLYPLPEIMKSEFDRDSLVYINDDEFAYNDMINPTIIRDILNHSLQIYGGYYEFKKGYESPKIYLIGRGSESGKFKLKIEGYYPYCYIKSKDGEYRTYTEDRVEKIIFRRLDPGAVKRFREERRRKGYDTPYEADILFVRRFLIDTYDYFKPINVIQPKVMILDIETNHPISDEIISYAINNQKDILFASKYDDLYPSELAIEIYEYLQKYDIVTGWNIRFDIDHLTSALEKVNRCLNYARLGYEYSRTEYISKLMDGRPVINNRDETERVIDKLIELNYLDNKDGVIILGERSFDPNIEHHISVMDLLTISKKMYGQEIKGKWTLGNTGMHIAGIDKMHIGSKHIRDLSEEELLNYNVLDTIIPEIIDNALGGIDAHVILAWSLQSRLEDVIITAVVNDLALLRAYHKAGIVLPSRDFSQKEDNFAYKAADPDAIPGIYNGVIAFDLKHAYPSAVISKNISIETKDENGKFIAPNGVRFNDKKSIFIETLKSIMEERQKVKEKLSSTKKYSTEWHRLKSIDFALKTQSAAFSHGIFGWANSRMRDYEVADAITSVVRDLLEVIKDACEVIGIKWIYSHTDSIYVNCSKEFKDGLGGYLNDIIKDYTMKDAYTPSLEFKGYYPIGYIHSKARNVLIPEGIDIDDSDHWEVTGCNFMRSEVPEELSNIEIEIIKQKMKGIGDETILNWLKKRIENLKYSSSTKLGLIRPLRKPIEQYGRRLKDGTYGGLPSHIKALLRAQKEFGLKISVGDKFMVIPILTDEIEGKRKIRRKRVDIAFDIEEGLPNNYKIDFEYYLRSNFWGKIHGLFNMTPKELEEKIMKDIKL